MSPKPFGGFGWARVDVGRGGRSTCALLLLLLCPALAACASDAPPRAAMPAALPENPLPPCPPSPNCVRETRLFDLPADTLFATARTALTSIGASDPIASPETRRLDAVFKVFFFKDDVALLVEPHETGAALHLRSASRVGRSDLGVNRRRVERFFDALDEALAAILFQ